MSINRRRFWLLVSYLLLLLPLIGYGASQAMQTKVNSPLDWVTSAFPARSDYDQFCQQFGNSDTVIISWPGCTIDNPDLDRFVKALRTATDFQDAQQQWYFERVISGRELYRSLSSPQMGLTTEEVHSRLEGTFIGADGKTSCLIVSFTPDGLQKRKTLVESIRSALQQHCQLDADQYHLAGPIIDGLEIDLASKDSLDQFVLPSTLIVLLICWICLRSFRAALLVFGLSLLAQGITLALIHFSGESITALLIVLPPLIQVLAVAGGIHLVNYYFDAIKDPNIEQPAAYAFQIGWLPCLLSAGTTAIGLASLLVSRLTPIRLFGGYAACGVLITTGLLLTLIPGMFSVWPLKRKTPKETESGNPPTVRHDIWFYLTAVLNKRHMPVACISLVAMAAAGYGISKTSTSVRIETLFPAQSKILQDYHWLEDHVGSLVPIEVVLTCTPESQLTFREQLLIVWRIEQELKKTETLNRTISTMTFAPRFPRPENLSTELFQYHANEALLRMKPQFIDAGYLKEQQGNNLFRITTYVSSLNNADYNAYLDLIGNKVETTIRGPHETIPPGISTQQTGIMPLVHEIQRQLMVDLFKSFLFAFVIIAVVMTIVQGGIIAGLVSMVSNVFPPLMIFGLLGWFSVSVDIGSVMTASVALGIAIDDTLHYLTFFRRRLEAGFNAVDSVLYAYRHCGTAMIQTSLICGLGLLVFAFSNFVPTSRFAWMMFGLLFMALLGDLIVLPALLLSPLGRFFAVATEQDQVEPQSEPFSIYD
ncbi:MMPL family transporter [uncultured Gimesia sp.]|uniref:efflux RND transporter permease subunit n=1 Tax=uncultured Gimesia sp. TaxID=1678688 RepID=UPI0030D968BF|tara:strand:+ start:48465 stop:50756 length:2292 start_codon:yes stop_codon:yes gene_type:complete